MKKYERENTRWTDEDLALLEESFGTSTLTRIAKKLKRSPKAVLRKVERLKLSVKFDGAIISLNEISKILGVDYSTVLRFKEKYDFPLKSKDLRLKEYKKYNTWYVDHDDFWKWAGEHKDVINWTRYKQGELFPEPKWLNEKIREQRELLPKNEKKYWTHEDDSKAWRLFYQGKTQKMIAEELGRSENAVCSRIAYLRRMKKRERKISK